VVKGTDSRNRKIEINVVQHQNLFKVVMTIDGQGVLLEQPWHPTKEKAEEYAAGLVLR
jgi:predicted double-glycine peptidase